MNSPTQDEGRRDGVAARRGPSRADMLFLTLITTLTALCLTFADSDFVYRHFYRWTDLQSVSEPAAVQHPGYQSFRIGRSCLPELHGDSCTIAARFTYHLDPDQAQEPVAVLVARFNGQLAVTVNGTFRHLQTSVQQGFRLLNRPPALVYVPSGVLHSGDNTIEVTVTAHSILGGFVDDAMVGAPAVLQVVADRDLIWTVSTPRMFDGALVILALAAAYIALRHGDRLYGIFAVLALSFFVSTLSPVLPVDTPEPIIQAINLARFVGGVLVLPFLAELLGVRSPVSLPVILTIPGGMYLTWMLASSNYEAMVSIRLFWLLVLLIVIAGLLMTLRHMIRTRSMRHATVIVGGLFGLLTSSTNFMHALGLPVPMSALMRGYASTAFVLILSVDLIRRFSDSLTAVRAANDAMRAEIARVTASLTASHQRAEEARRELSIQKERQRLMGDLHDGLAGNLISIRALAEQRDLDALPDVAQLSQSALLDLRLVVDSLDSFEGDLAAVIAAFRERIDPQLRAQDVVLHWDMAQAPVLQNLTPETNLAIYRILQEAISNARRHGKADVIRIVVRPSRSPAHCARIFVVDNGHGLRGAPLRPGFGLRNMRRRARQIGASVRLRFTSAGAVMLLRIDRPCLAPAAPLAPLSDLANETA